MLRFIVPTLDRALFLVLFLASAGLGWRLLRRHGGPGVFWIVAWAAAGLGATFSLAGPDLPAVRQLEHLLGTQFAALLLAASLAFAERPVPGWLLPAALAWGAARAVLAAAGFDSAAWLLALALEPWAVLAGAWVVWRAAAPPATRAERWLGPGLVVLALTGAFYVAWLASGRTPERLVPLWIAVVPPLLGLQLLATADRERRAARRELDARVAERTMALLASEERYRAVTELSADLSFRVRIAPDLDLRPEWTAGAVFAITRRSPETLTGRGWLALLPEDARESLRAGLATMPTGRRFELERSMLGPQGEELRVAVRVVAVAREPDGSVVLVGSASDVSERYRAEQEHRRLEAHLARIQRLESLGALAGGIAHDFNNLLTVIRGHARLALDEGSPDASLRERLLRIEEAAGHAADLTGQMLAYAGKAAPELAPLDVGEVVGSLADLLRASLPERCALEIDCAPDLPAVEGDAGQLRQVLLNLALNAAEAHGERPGRVAIHVGVESLAGADLADAVGAAELAPGRFVVLSVRDEGCGMDAATVARVCEPFFTTRFSGRGLGMAAVLGIVRAHHGGLAIDSAPGRGTTVRVLLPVSERPAESLRAPQQIAVPDGQGARVLVVDDDPAVRELAAEVLARAGFAVRCAASGREAIAALEGGAAIDAVLLDLAMPDLDGEATFLRLRALRPGLPVVLVSGYDVEQAAQRFAAAGLDAFLRKPFEPRELAAAVQASLRTPRG